MREAIERVIDELRREHDVSLEQADLEDLDGQEKAFREMIGRAFAFKKAELKLKAVLEHETGDTRNSAER